MNKRRFFMCSSKNMYTEEKHALGKANKIMRDFGTKMKVYKYEYCSGYHLAKDRTR